jgi:hypothetical protein
MRTFNIHKQKPIMKLANRIEIYTQPEEIPVRGNALAFGDDAIDREADFRAGGYFDDMVKNCMEELQ